MTIQFDGNTGIVTTGNVTANNFIGNFSGNITVPGTNTEVIFNDSGIANGSLGFTFDKTSNTVTIDGEIVSTDANVTGTLLANTLVTGETTVNGNATINGNLTVSGNVSFIDIERIETEDPMIVVGVGPNGAPLTSNDGRDRGVQMDYYSNSASAQQSAFVGWINSSGNMVAASNVSITNDVVTVNQLGTMEVGNLLAAGTVTATSFNSLSQVNGFNIYVDCTRTDVYFENGSPEQPFKTIAAAIAAAEAGTPSEPYSFILAGGTYQETIDLNDTTLEQVTFASSGRAIISPTTGNSLQSFVNNSSLTQLSVYDIEFSSPIVVSGDGTGGQFSTVVWQNVTFMSDITFTSLNQLILLMAASRGNATIKNISYFYLDGAQTTSGTSVDLEANNTLPIPSNGLSPARVIAYNIQSTVDFVVVGAVTLFVQISNCRFGIVGGAYTLPAGAELTLRSSTLFGTWTNNGTITLRNSSSDNPILGTPPRYIGEIGGENLFIDGNVTANANVIGLNGNFTEINVTGDINSGGNINPTANNTFSLGNVTNQWKDLYVSGNTIFMSNVPLTVSGNTLQINGANVLTDTGGGGNTIIAGNVTIEGDTLNSTSNTFFLLDDTITEINFGGNATTINIGANTGNTTINHNLIVDGNTTLVDLEVTNNVVIDSNLTVNGTTILSELEVTGNANIIGNTITGGILTDNYFYANGAPVDFEQPAGSNTQIQFNDDDDFGASSGLTFNKDTNNLSATGNVVAGNIYSQYIYGTSAGSNLVITATGTNSSITVVPTGVGSLDVSFKRITSLATPVVDSDAATKLYVDEVAQGLKVKQSVYAGTTSALSPYIYDNGTAGVGATIVANNPGALALDGTTPPVGSRVLIKNEIGANAPYNGIYEVTVAGDGSTAFELTRTLDFDGDNSTGGEVDGAFTFISNGATLADTGWVCIANEPVTIGTTDLDFIQFSGAGTYLAGAGLTLTGEVFSVNVDNDTTEITPQGNVVVKPGANFVTPNIGNAVGNSLTLTGNLSAANIFVGNVEIGNLTVDEIDANTANITGNLVAGNVTTAGTANIGTLTVTGNANITGNTAVGGILTDNYFYANGAPVDFEQPAGSNTQIQFNDNGDFGASANFTFNNSTNLLTVTGNISGSNIATVGTANVGALIVTGNAAVSGNIGVTGNVVGGNVNTIGTANIGTLAVTGTAGITGNLVAGNVTTTGTANIGTLAVTGNANVVGNISAGNVNTVGTANIGTLAVTGNANVVGNAEVGGILTDNYYYANGQPVDFEQPAGSNTQIQFNDNGDFGASANFTFNESTNVLTVAGNISGANLVTSGVVAATGNITGGNLTTTGTANVGTLAVTGNAGVVGNAVIGNVRTQYIYGTPAGSNIVITTTGVDSSITVVPTGAGSLDVSNKRITSLATPTTDSDAATKLYVDEVAQGLKVKDSVVAASAGPLSSYTYNNGTAGVGATITANSPGALILDGVTVSNGNRVLIKNETAGNAPYNGIYIVTVAGDGSTAFVLTRTADFDNSPTGEVAGAFVFIQQGSTLADTGFVCITDEPVVMGTTPLTFVQFSGAGTYLAGDGLTLTGEVFSVNVDNDTTEITPQGNVIVKPSANFVTPNIGNAVGNSLTLTGNLTAGNLVVGNVEIGNLIVDEVDANTANITGNAAFGGVLTDNYYYANGAPVDFEQPAGSNTQIQYNSNGDFGASSNFTFNESSNVLTVTGNIQSNVLGITGNITSGNISTGALTSTTSINANSVVISNTMSVGANAQFSANVAITNNLTVGGNITVDGNINLIGNINEITGNTGVFYGEAVTGFDALYAGIQTGFAVLDQTVVQSSGNFNGFVQINFQNINTGEKASTDFVCTADIGNNEAYYVNMGIASSTFDGSEPVSLGNVVFPNDGYLYTQDGNMVLGTPSTGKVTKIVSGGQGTDFQVATFNPGGTVSTSTTTGAMIILGGAGIGGNLYSSNVNTGNITATAAAISGNITAGNVNGGNLVTANFFTGTLTTAAQPNITSVGTLTLLAVTGNITGGNIGTAGVITATGNITGGNLSGTNVTGTLTTAAQPNVTSVGTLTSLAVTGNITGGNVTGGNLVTANFFTGTLTTAAQPNVTSVGTLTGLGVTGNITAGNVNGGNLVSANFVTGTLTTAAQPNVTSVGTLTSLNVTGNVTANNFVGNVVGNITGNITVPGANTNVIFNDDGLANASTGFTFNKTTNSVAVTGNLSAGNVGGANLVSANFFTGTLTTAAQPNVTSVGTLTSLDVTGNITGGNLNTAGRVVASRLESNVATGTSPLIVASTTLVANLNADLLDGYNSSITAVANTVVVRDANANVAANVFTGNSIDVTGNAIIGGNLVVSGNIIYTNITDLNISDPVIGLGRGPNNTPLTTNDGKDRGTEMWYYTTSEKSAFFGYDNTTGKLFAATDITNTADVITVNSYGNLVVGGLEADTISATSASLTSLGVTGNITSGNVSGTTGAFTNVSGNGSALTALNASNITTGTLDQSRLANAATTLGSTALTLGSTVTTVAGLTSVTSTTFVGALTGAATSATTAGTVTTAAQPNITSTGTLTSLAVTGNITSGNVSGTTGAFTNVSGNGSALTALNASNISTGTLSQARLANVSTTLGSTTLTLGETVTTVAGLTSVTSTTFVGALTGAATSATTAGTVTTAAQPNITSTGTLTSLAVTGNITSGNVSGTTGAFTNVGGTLTTAAQPNITSTGTLTSLAVTGNITSGNVSGTTGAFTNVSGNGSALTALNASNISTGTLSQARLANASLTVNGTSITLGGSGTVTANAQTLTGTSLNATVTGSSLTSVGTLGSLAVTGTATIGTVQTATLTTGASGTAGSITGNWTLTAGSRLEATYADLAERYRSDHPYQPGTILMIGGSTEVTIADVSGKYRLAGIVSTAPAYVLNSTIDKSVIVALTGRVPCRVVGKIAKGDLITISDIPGVGTSIVPPASGVIVGRALESYDSDEVGVIEVKVDQC